MAAVSVDGTFPDCDGVGRSELQGRWEREREHRS